MRTRGFSLVEMLVAMAIVAMLLTATMVAIHASFQAYAVAAERASAQSNSRLVVHRLLTMIRTSTAHGPLDEVDAEYVADQLSAAEGLQVSVGDLAFERQGDELQANAMVLQAQSGLLYGLYYDADEQRLWLVEGLGDEGAEAQPLLGGLEQGRFFLRRRIDREGMYMLQRGAIDLRVLPDEDSTLAIEAGSRPTIELFASTMPRRLMD